MSLASFRFLRLLGNPSFCSTKFHKVSYDVVRNASQTDGTPGIAGLGGKVGKISGRSINVKISVLPVETNVERLQTHLCGSNLLKEGGEDVQLKPDSEYPDWLWKFNLGPSPHYSELDPNDKKYWMQLKRHWYKQWTRIKAKRRF